jgi:hypothetical protein
MLNFTHEKLSGLALLREAVLEARSTLEGETMQ